MVDSLPQRQVLLVKTSSLGDVIHAMPAITEAAQHNVRFTWVVEEAFAEVAALHPAVDQVIPVALRRWRKGGRGVGAEFRSFVRQLRGQSFDLVLDSQGLIKSAFLSGLAPGPSAGFSHTSAREPWAAFFYGARHAVAKGQHAVQRQRQLFAQALGYALQPQLPHGLSLSAEPSRRVLLLHGTTWQTKHWPQAMWVGLAQLIAEAGFEPAVTWGNEAEQTRAEDIAKESAATLIPRMGLTELASVLAGAAAVVGVDTGLTHLSATMGTPTVGIYGPTSPELTGCMGTRCVSLSSELACAPCLSASCRDYAGPALQWHSHSVTPACFAQTTPAVVWAQVSQLMSLAKSGVAQ